MEHFRPHVARVNMGYLYQPNTDVLPLPALSADLSPIEHLWNQLDRRVRHRQQDTFDEICVSPRRVTPLSYINQLITSIHPRCRAVVNNRGSIHNIL